MASITRKQLIGCDHAESKSENKIRPVVISSAVSLLRREIAQELECNFNMSGETVFAAEDLESYHAMVRQPKHRTGFDRNLWIWEERQHDSTYILAADVARGEGKDYSICHVMKLETMEIVAEYQGKCTPGVFSRVLFDMGQEYGNGLLVVENNSVGFAVLDKLKEMRYPNLYHSIKFLL